LKKEAHEEEIHQQHGDPRYLQVPKAKEDKQSDSFVTYSIEDIFRDAENLEEVALKVIDFAAFSAIMPEGGPPESSREAYMKVKLTKLQNKDQQRVMLSFIDISDTVLYGKS